MSTTTCAPQGRLFGYARVSTEDQDLTIQRERLMVAGCHVVRTEKASGTSLKDRTELASLLEFLREGDTLVVTRIDRLARSLKDLQDIIHDLKARGIALKATEQPIDTSTPAGKASLEDRTMALRNAGMAPAAIARERGELHQRSTIRPVIMVALRNRSTDSVTIAPHYFQHKKTAVGAETMALPAPAFIIPCVPVCAGMATILRSPSPHALVPYSSLPVPHVVEVGRLLRHS